MSGKARCGILNPYTESIEISACKKEMSEITITLTQYQGNWIILPKSHVEVENQFSG